MTENNLVVWNFFRRENEEECQNNVIFWKLKLIFGKLLNYVLRLTEIRTKWKWFGCLKFLKRENKNVRKRLVGIVFQKDVLVIISLTCFYFLILKLKRVWNFENVNLK